MRFNPSQAGSLAFLGLAVRIVNSFHSRLKGHHILAASGILDVA